MKTKRGRKAKVKKTIKSAKNTVVTQAHKLKNKVFNSNGTKTIIVSGKEKITSGLKTVGNTSVGVINAGRDAGVGIAGVGLIAAGKGAMAVGQQLVKVGSGIIEKAASEGNKSLHAYAKAQANSVKELTVSNTLATIFVSK